MKSSIFIKTTIASLMLAGAAGLHAQQRPTPLYSTTTTFAVNQPYAIATTLPTSSNPRSQYVVVATAASEFSCIPVCRSEPILEVNAWNDTTTSLVHTGTSGSAGVSGSLAALALSGLDSGRVVSAEVDGAGVLSIRTWSVGASGVSLQNSYSTPSQTASPQVAIATLSSTEVVTAYALPNGTLAVESWTIGANGLPAPVSTVGYQNDDLTGNEILPAQNGVFATQVSIAAVNPNQVVTAIADSSESLWVTTWGINSGVQPQQLQQLPNTVDTYQGAIAVGAGQSSELVPGIGTRPPHYETVQTAFTPFANGHDFNVLYWTISTTGQLTLQPVPTASSTLTNTVSAVTLTTNVPMSSFSSDPGGIQTQEYYHGYFPPDDASDPWATTLSPGMNAPPAIDYVNAYFVGPVGSASEGNSPPSFFETYNAYFVTVDATFYNTLYIQVFSYPLPPTSVTLL